MTGTGQGNTYAKLWENGTYGAPDRGSPSQGRTPLLDVLIERLHQQLGATSLIPHVFEGGAGSGDHALLLAQEGFRVTANEYNRTGVERIERRKLTLSNPSLLRTIEGDVLHCISAQEAHSIDGFYANSLLHTFSAEERVLLYRGVHKTQSDRGVLAVSFKAQGDTLQRTGIIREETEAGPIVVDDQGIRRLFVTNPEPLMRELNTAGYRVVRTCRWNIERYIAVTTYVLGARKFIGFFAEREQTKGDT